jgi:hypothetical protein
MFARLWPDGGGHGRLVGHANDAAVAARLDHVQDGVGHVVAAPGARHVGGAAENAAVDPPA